MCRSFWGLNEKIKSVLESEEEMNRRIYEFPTSQIQLDGKKSSYYEVISSLRFRECNNAVVRMCPKVDLGAIRDLINSIENISDMRKKFYKEILQYRYRKFMWEPYLALTKG